MNNNLFEEDLSVSYLRAVAAQAKITFELNHRDNDSKDVDLKKTTITSNGGKFNAELSVQLKATYSKNCYSETEEEVKYQLKAKNYNDLCMDGTNHIILCLLVLPDDSQQWVTQSPEALTLKRCMYWLSLQGETETKNTDSVTVTIPKSNVVTAEALNKMIDIIANGGSL